MGKSVAVNATKSLEEIENKFKLFQIIMIFYANFSTQLLLGKIKQNS